MNSHDIVNIVIDNNIESLAAIRTYLLKGTIFWVENKEIPESMRSNLSLIHVAALYDSLECFIYLESIGLSIDTKCGSSLTPLHFAATADSTEVLLYVNHSCSVDKTGKKKKILKKIFEEDYMAPEEMRLVTLAALSNSNIALQLLFSNQYGIKYNGSNIRSSIVEWPLSVAVRCNHLECIKTLAPYFGEESKKQSPLQIAISAGRRDAIDLLIDSNISLDHRDERNETALSFAALFQDIETTRMICERMESIDIPSNESLPGAIHWMCRSGNVEIMEVILQHYVVMNRLDHKKRPGHEYIHSSLPSETIIRMLQLLKDYNYNINNPAHPAMAYFLSTIRVYPKVIEWFLEQNVNLDFLMPPKVGQATITIKDRLLKLCIDPKIEKIVQNYGISN